MFHRKRTKIEDLNIENGVCAFSDIIDIVDPNNILQLKVLNA